MGLAFGRVNSRKCAKTGQRGAGVANDPGGHVHLDRSPEEKLSAPCSGRRFTAGTASGPSKRSLPQQLPGASRPKRSHLDCALPFCRGYLPTGPPAGNHHKVVDRYDFSKSERGKSFRPNAELRLPIYLNADVEAYLPARGQEGRAPRRDGECAAEAGNSNH